ncbi:MAG: ATP-dependent Clp protease proteolytic subunit [Actinomycetia bacterium]|jgi:ATP-dependent Clp protease protease subunit|nr:ATP-dependent Clp protease proteolytic subunit [Actinomycetes bacterium]
MQLQMRSSAPPAPSEQPDQPDQLDQVPVSFGDDVSRRMLRQRRVMLTGTIDGPLAERVCAQLLVIEAEEPELPITLYLHSPGGEVDAGFAIYDTMQTLRCEVETVCVGFAASMAQFLLCGGAPGRRAAYAHSRILMHQPLGSVQGYAVDIAIQAEQFTIMRRLMAELTAEHTGQTVERILADGERDRWFTPPDALEYGMIDRIIEAPVRTMPR